MHGRLIIKQVPLFDVLFHVRHNCHIEIIYLNAPFVSAQRRYTSKSALLRLAVFDPPRQRNRNRAEQGIERDAKRRRSLWQTRPRHGRGGTRADEEDEEETKSKKGSSDHPDEG